MGTPKFVVASTTSHTPFERARDHGPAALPRDGSVVSGTRPLEAGLPPGDVGGAVIIPAHDEAAVIARTLTALAPLTGLDGFEVIVACNGCHDDTASVARTFDGVIVAETSTASKPAGLNLGDAVATRWPRLYLDADIDISPRAVVDTMAELSRPGVLAARPRYVYDTGGATLPVRAYYRARSRIPAPPSRLWGAGGYATNSAGHGRFERFASVTADDSWFDAQFDDGEKRIVATQPMRVRTPRDTAALLAVLTRQRRGYLEIGVRPQTQHRGRALLSSVHSLGEAADAVWYLLLTVVSRRRVRLAARRGQASLWERDASTRERAAVA